MALSTLLAKTAPPAPASHAAPRNAAAGVSFAQHLQHHSTAKLPSGAVIQRHSPSSLVRRRASSLRPRPPPLPAPAPSTSLLPRQPAATVTSTPAKPKLWADLLKKSQVATTSSARSSPSAAPPTAGYTTNVEPSEPRSADEELVDEPNNQPRMLSEILQGVECNYDAPYLFPRGLVNNGNICFANAILQVLIHCAPFYNLLSLIRTHTTHSFVSPSPTPLLDAMLSFATSFHPMPASELDPVPQSEDWVQANATKGKGKRGSQDGTGDEKQTRRNVRYKVPKPPGGATSDYTDPFVAEGVWAATKGNSRFDAMRRGQQEDAQEFLGFFLDTLNDEVLLAVERHDNELKTKYPSLVEVIKIDDVTHVNGLAPDSSQEDEWLEVGSKGRAAVTRLAEYGATSAISKIFDLQTRSVLHRPGLKDSITFEPNNALQLDISPMHVTSITSALLHMCIPEPLPDYPGHPRGATKQVWVERWPSILVCHLKRFQWAEHANGTSSTTGSQSNGFVGKQQSNGTTSPPSFGIVKNGKWIEVGEEFQVPDEARTPSQRGTKVQYRLFAIVYHHGPSAQGGHYTTSLRQHLTQTWIHIDDTQIQTTSANEVSISLERATKTNSKLKSMNHHINNNSNHHHNGGVEVEDKSAYLIFYERVS